ncbi:substrate-binding domain-containing protein [Streptomyces radiopugnans]|uniref:histidine kinase n=1 Tax=Streptomyces radiopugnans TaxID=403935 RepID=A0A1H9BE33_9ACTN|nr:substrate-binding domain-containing protein [Streptomyces radiopugnans]SEP86528.1 DNA-binding transcriptional regulator, LacI/PurR family [Streptomyces radiopugnans]
MAERGPVPARREGTGKGRPTLGLVTANIHLGVGATLWSGVLAAAERCDVNLVCFPGGPLRPAGAPRTALYELVGPERLDGVICWTSTLGLPADGDERAARLVRRLRELPVVSLNRALEDHETLQLDSYAGMRAAVSHLVKDHGRRRLACVRGPLANPVSRDRHRAYADALARHRITPDRSLTVASADFGGGAGAAAMRVLTDVRGLRPGRDFDAVVACSDVLAADALRFLTGHGVRVPEDVAVVGFNDSLEARLADPPLTSVALPFAELGELAVDTLLARLRGTAPPARRAVPGALVVRRSCGCHSPLVTQGARGVREAGEAAGQDEGRGEPFEELPEHGTALAGALRADLCPAGGESADGRGEVFLPLVERLVGDRVRTAGDAADWDRSLLRARGLLAPRLAPEARARAERLLGQARLMVADKSHRLLEYERWAEQQDARRLRELGTALTTAVDMEALTGALARHLPDTGVPGCRLALYEGGHLSGEGTGRLLARPVPAPAGAPGAPGGPDGPGEPGYPRPEWDDDGAPHPARLLLPDRLLPQDRRFTLVVEPLHIGEEQLGFALFDGGPGGGPDGGAGTGAARRGALYRALGDQISAALKGIRLFDEVRRARDAAEQASRLKTRLLDNATDELRTPVEAILRHTRVPGPGFGPGSGPETSTETGPETSTNTGAADALRRAHGDAARLLRLIDDLLDLSRSEIDALDLSRRLLDPRLVLVEAFHGAARHPLLASADRRLALPRRLPAVQADAPRLRQIVLNLLAAAGHLADGGRLRLTAEVLPALLRVRVLATGLRVPPGEAEHLFQPFASGAPGSRLGLAIARRLAALHGGTVALDRGPAGSGFRLDLPLPTPAETAGTAPVPALAPGAAPGTGRTLLVAAANVPPPEATALARRQNLPLRRLDPDDDLASLVAEGGPAAVVWDAEGARPQEWSAVRRLHDHPALRHTPFLFYGPVSGPDLDRALRALRPPGLTAPAVVADPCAARREQWRRLLAGALPGRTVRTAADGAAALALIAEDAPCLLVVCRTLPDMDGFDVAEATHDGAERSDTPVLMVGDEGFTADDVRRAEPHPGMVFLGRGILTDAETAALLAVMARRAEPPSPSSPSSPQPSRTRAPVRSALVYLEQHYRHRISRWQVARAAGVSEDHLSRLFHRELGVPLWEYLTRLRVQRAKERLRHSGDSVQTVARAVGFHDRAYFSRVFRKVTGVAPHAYREVP